jgi:sugar/nucleoside kinase (ribokinase family)
MLQIRACTSDFLFRYNLTMYRPMKIEPIDYLMIGHITLDKTSHGLRLGGTTTFSSLMAKALGLRVGIVTSWGTEISLGPLADIPIINLPAEHSTTFENISTSRGRIQSIFDVANTLDINLIPEEWLSAAIVHIGPVAQEVEPTIVRHLSNPLVGVTPQGWLRTWDSQGSVLPSEWPEAAFVLNNVGAAVISVEDIGHDESRIEELATACRVLAVTEGSDGVRLFWNGDVRRFRPPEVDRIDATGAGDIFAAAFFFRMYTTRDPWESARFATQLAASSVTRSGLAGIPTQEEIQACMAEVL